MLKKLALGSGLAMAAVAMAVVPALAYSGTPGTSASTNATTVGPGGAVSFTAHFPGGAGQVVTYSASGGGAGCTVTFNPASGTTDVNGNVSTLVTIGGNCSGVLDITATSGAQNVSTSITVTAFPAAASLPFGIPVPFAWMAVLLAGLVLVGASLFGFGRRRQPVRA